MDENETARNLRNYCEDTLSEVMRAGMRGGCDGLIGFVDAFSLEDRRSGKTTWEFTLTTGGPGVWLRVTPRRATLIGAWGSERIELPVPLEQRKLRMFVEELNANADEAAMYG